MINQFKYLTNKNFYQNQSALFGPLFINDSINDPKNKFQPSFGGTNVWHLEVQFYRDPFNFSQVMVRMSRYHKNACAWPLINGRLKSQPKISMQVFLLWHGALWYGFKEMSSFCLNIIVSGYFLVPIS